MYEATQMDIGSQLVKIPTATSWLDPFPQQADPARQIHGCGGRAANQITKGKEVPTWIRSPSG